MGDGLLRRPSRFHRAGQSQRIRGWRCRWKHGVRGAGLAIAAKAITATELTRLITDTALASVTGEVRQEMAAMPGPEDLVPRLEALTG
jgi:hypothetical protein